MAKKRENKFLSFIVVIILIVFVGVIYIVLSSGNLYKNTFNSQRTSSQIYKSKTLKFSVDVPSKFEIEDTGITVSLKNPNGVMDIIRNGTQFNNINDYLVNADSKVKIKAQQKNEIIIGGLNVVSRVEYSLIEPKRKYKIYYIYSNSSVYAISTSSEALFDDLDKIAQSFKYTP